MISLQFESPTIESLSKSAVDLAQATADFGALKVFFGVFLIVVLGMFLLFFYQIILNNKKISKIEEYTKKSNDYFQGVNEHTLGESAANVLIRREIAHIAALVKYQIVRVRLENHLEDTEEIKTKITRLVENNFVELHTFLSNYTVNGKKLSSVIDPKDKPAMVDLMIEQVYVKPEKFYVYSMDQTVDIFMSGIKNIYVEKI